MNFTTSAGMPMAVMPKLPSDFAIAEYMQEALPLSIKGACSIVILP